MSRFLSFCLLPIMIALPASAQQYQPPGPLRPEMAKSPDIAAMMVQEGDDMALVLGLSAAQRPALDAFLKTFGPPPHRDRPEGPPSMPTFADRLAMMEADFARHAAEEKERIGAARALYASLDARQRRMFEALQRLRHGGGPRPGGFGGPGGPGHPGMPPFNGDGSPQSPPH